MYKRIVSFAMICLLFVSLMCSCADNDGEQTNNIADTQIASSGIAYSPEISQIREICNLATLECYYHNVAKSTKEPGSGLLHIGEKERIFWIEYSGNVTFGIDISKVTMEIDGEQINITIPGARLLGMSEYNFTEDSYISSDDGINKNPITAENQTEAIAAANEQIRQLFANDETMLMRAQNRAKRLIENYIDKLGALSGIEYQINWQYEDNISEDGSSTQ